MGNCGYLDATCSKSPARLRWAHKGVRIPGLRLGSNRAPRGLAKARREERAVAQGSYQYVVHLVRGREQRLHVWGRAQIRKAHGNAVVHGDGLDVDGQNGPSLLPHAHGERNVNALAVRGQKAHAVVAQFVAHALDHQVPVRGHHALLELIAHVLKELGLGVIVEGGAERAFAFFAELPRQCADAGTELRTAARAVAVPEGHLAGLAGRRHHEHALVGDALHAPRRGTQEDNFAFA